jgi:hypothetical protein
VLIPTTTRRPQPQDPGSPPQRTEQPSGLTVVKMRRGRVSTGAATPRPDRSDCSGSPRFQPSKTISGGRQAAPAETRHGDEGLGRRVRGPLRCVDRAYWGRLQDNVHSAGQQPRGAQDRSGISQEGSLLPADLRPREAGVAGCGSPRAAANARADSSRGSDHPRRALRGVSWIHEATRRVIDGEVVRGEQVLHDMSDPPPGYHPVPS